VQVRARVFSLAPPFPPSPSKTSKTYSSSSARLSSLRACASAVSHIVLLKQRNQRRISASDVKLALAAGKNADDRTAPSPSSPSLPPLKELACSGRYKTPRRFSIARSGKPRRSLLPLRLRGVRAAAAANSRLHGFTIIGCLRGRRQRRRRRRRGVHEAHTGVASPPVEIASAVPHNN